jgi:3-phosphoshikimate 1-carboxyvinyltransferase
VLTLLTKNSVLRIKDVSLNKTRTGILIVLKNMGGKIEIENQREIAGEDLGDIIAYSSKLQNVDIPEEIIPNIIDEIPILTVAGVFASSSFKINKVAELRGKETDRIKAICYNLNLLGLSVNELENGFDVSGNMKNEKVIFESFEDHRIAMAFAIMSLLLKQGGKVNNFNCVNISNPNFLSQLKLIVR